MGVEDFERVSPRNGLIAVAGPPGRKVSTVEVEVCPVGRVVAGGVHPLAGLEQARLTERITAQGKALARAIEALSTTEPSGPFERALARLLLAAYKRRLRSIVAVAPAWGTEERSVLAFWLVEMTFPMSRGLLPAGLWSSGSDRGKWKRPSRRVGTVLPGPCSLVTAP